MAETLIEAQEQGAEQAVFVIHEFVSARMNALTALENKADLIEFIEILTGLRMLYTTGHLKGPFTVPGGGRVPTSIQLYIGYLRTPTTL